MIEIIEIKDAHRTWAIWTTKAITRARLYRRLSIKSLNEIVLSVAVCFSASSSPISLPVSVSFSTPRNVLKTERKNKWYVYHTSWNKNGFMTYLFVFLTDHFVWHTYIWVFQHKMAGQWTVWLLVRVEIQTRQAINMPCHILLASRLYLSIRCQKR